MPKTAHLIKLCLKEDRAAQKEMFEYLAPMLLAVSKRYSPQHLDPLDNLQDGFIRIFKNLASFNEEKGSFEAWTKRIIINCAITKLNKKYDEVELQDKHENHYFEDETILEQITLSELHKVIEKLPDGIKQVFCLYEIEGYSHSEIGKMLEIQEATSRSQLFRSKKILQKMLEAQYEKRAKHSNLK